MTDKMFKFESSQTFNIFYNYGDLNDFLWETFKEKLAETSTMMGNSLRSTTLNQSVSNI